MEKIIDIADYRRFVYIVYFKKDFTLNIESRKRGISFSKNTPYLLYRGDPTKYYIGKLKIDRDNSKEILNCNGKAYTIMDFEIDNIIPYVDAIFPEHIEGNTDKNLLINTYILTKIESKEVLDVVDDIGNYIVSVENGKGYIKLSLFFNRGTYLSIDIRDLSIDTIDGYSIGMYSGSPVYLSIDDDYLDEKFLTKILYSLYDNYKFKDEVKYRFSD